MAISPFVCEYVACQKNTSFVTSVQRTFSQKHCHLLVCIFSKFHFPFTVPSTDVGYGPMDRKNYY